MNWYRRHELSSLALIATQVTIVVDRVRKDLALEDPHKAVLKRAAGFFRRETQSYRPDRSAGKKQERLMAGRAADLLYEQSTDHDVLGTLAELPGRLERFAEQPDEREAGLLYEYFDRMAKTTRAGSRRSDEKASASL